MFFNFLKKFETKANLPRGAGARFLFEIPIGCYFFLMLWMFLGLQKEVPILKTTISFLLCVFASAIIIAGRLPSCLQAIVDGKLKDIIKNWLKND